MENKQSILQFARGAIEERVDYEVSRVVDNILDRNTAPTAKRKITLTIEMQPDSERQTITLKATAKSALAPTNAISTALAITSDSSGEMLIAEMLPQIPGQMDMNGNEQAKPKILKLANM